MLFLLCLQNIFYSILLVFSRSFTHKHGFFKSTQQNNFTFPMWIFDALQTNCFNSILIND